MMITILLLEVYFTLERENVKLILPNRKYYSGENPVFIAFGMFTGAYFFSLTGFFFLADFISAAAILIASAALSGVTV